MARDCKEMAAKEFNDAQNYGPHAELYFFLLRGIRRETGPIEPGHVSNEKPEFYDSLAQPQSWLLPAGNHPLCQGALGGFPWRAASGPDGPEGGPALFTRAGPARTGEWWSSLA